MGTQFPGTVSINDDGQTRFTENAGGRHSCVTQTRGVEAITSIIEALMMHLQGASRIG